MSRVVLVCGGRDYTDNMKVDEVLSAIHAERPIGILINGDARGADSFARAWASNSTVPVANVPANWWLGPKAGPIRNSAMLLLAPSLVVAFPGGAGTADTVRKAKKQGIEVMEIAP